jgi:hypothetical protein
MDFDAVRDARSARIVQRALEAEGVEQDVGFMFDTAHAKDNVCFSFDINGNRIEDEVDMEKELFHVDLAMIKGEPGHVQSGQYLWPAAQASVQWMIQHADKLLSTNLDKSSSLLPLCIVELGAGCGLTSLGVCQICPERVQHVILTDHDYGSVQLLERNAEALYERIVNNENSFGLNLLSLEQLQKERERPFMKEERHAATFLVHELEWGDELPDDIKVRCNDGSDVGTHLQAKQQQLLVLGADLLYCIDVVVPLFTTVKKFLSLSSLAQATKQKSMFVLTSSFDIGDDINTAVSDAIISLGLTITEEQALDVSASQCRVQYVHLENNIKQLESSP